MDDQEAAVEHGRDGHTHGGHDHNGHDHEGRSFDERSRDWDDDDRRAHTRKLATMIRTAAEPDTTTRLLEYGAGTGLVTQYLAEDGLGPVTLVDPSVGMREVMAEKVADGRLPADAQIRDVDLAEDDLRDEAFDLVAIVMALHHVPDITPVLAKFRRLLADDGHLCVVDLEHEDGSFHEGEDLDVHNGFERDELAGLLDSVGFTDVAFQSAPGVYKHGRTYPVFLAVARHTGHADPVRESIDGLVGEDAP